MSLRLLAAASVGSFALLAADPATGLKPDVLRSIDAVPAHLAGRFRDPAGFQQSSSGQYFVFDRRGHTVYGLDAQKASAWEIIQIGAEQGRILDPTAFAVAPDGTFVVADAPGSRERVQVFTPVGFVIGGFGLPDRVRPRVTLDRVVIGGIGSLQYTGTAIYLSVPEHGALVTEYTTHGYVTRLFGTLRATGHESDRDLHLALNTGVLLVNPRGGFYFVFQTGEPVFRRYDEQGGLIFERRMQGLEIDGIVAGLPTEWPRRRTEEGELPLVAPTIRAAAVDRDGNLWVSFVAPYTYVYDADGDKIRTLQLQAAGLVAPDSLSFGPSGRLLVAPGLYEFDPREHR